MEENRQSKDIKKNKFNRNLKFVTHPESRFTDEIYRSFWKLFLIAVIWQFFIRMATNTPEMGWLLGSSLGFFLMYAYFKFIRIPRVLKGYDEAYFKRSYKGTVLRFIVVEKCAPVALGIVSGNFIYFAQQFSQGRTVGNLLKFVLFFNPIAVIVGALIVWFIYYLDFGKEKYVTVRDYSNLYNYYRSKGSAPIYECHQRVLQKKDQDHNIHEFEGAYFDEKEVEELLSIEVEENNLVKRKKRY